MIVRLPIALILGLLAALAIGCGDRAALIPEDDSASLDDQLSQVRAAIADGECRTAASAAIRLREQADSLPSSIDARLREQIRDGADRLVAAVPRDCEAAETPPQTTETTPTLPDTTETTPTIPETPETTPTTPETTPTTPDPTVPDPTNPGPTTPGPDDGTGGTGGPLGATP